MKKQPSDEYTAWSHTAIRPTNLGSHMSLWLWPAVCCGHTHQETKQEYSLEKKCNWHIFTDRSSDLGASIPRLPAFLYLNRTQCLGLAACTWDIAIALTWVRRLRRCSGERLAADDRNRRVLGLMALGVLTFGLLDGGHKASGSCPK
jgi:hypothetical protein